MQGEFAISKLIPVTIGKVKQWIYIRGRNRNKPILLMLHGGPGTGQIGFIRKFQHELEKEFVVVHWDQRGAGLSYSKNISKDSMTIDQFVRDTIEITKYILHYFKREQLYLIGHSWGTIIGMLAIARSPELYKRYFGISQVVNVKENEHLSYMKILDHATQNHDEKAYQHLIKIGPPPWESLKKGRVHQKYVHQFGGGITRDGKMINQIISGLLLSKEYTLIDVIRYFKGMQFSMKHLQAELLTINLAHKIKTIGIPIYFLMGKHDLITPYERTEKFFNQLHAPEKKWFLFNHSAHTPYIEEHDKFLKILLTEVKKDFKNKSKEAKK